MKIFELWPEEKIYSFNDILIRAKKETTKEYNFLSESCVIHATKCSQTATLASGKIAMFLSEYLNIPLVDDKKHFSKNKRKYKYLFIVSSLFNWCHFLDDLKKLISNADKIIWVQNDYAIKPPKLWQNKIYSVWTTIKFLENDEKTFYINWNKLLYIDIPNLYHNKIDKLFYYGAFRKKRIKYFEKYFIDPEYKMAISASHKAKRKYYDINSNIDIVPPCKNLTQIIAKYAATIYIEDTWSHENYCSPANRFYECVGAGIPILFDNNCAKTFDIAGYDISQYIVSNKEDIFKKWDDLKNIQKNQNIWKRDYVKELFSEINNALKQMR